MLTKSYDFSRLTSFYNEHFSEQCEESTLGLMISSRINWLGIRQHNIYLFRDVKTIGAARDVHYDFSTLLGELPYKQSIGNFRISLEIAYKAVFFWLFDDLTPEKRTGLLSEIKGLLDIWGKVTGCVSSDVDTGPKETLIRKDKLLCFEKQTDDLTITCHRQFIPTAIPTFRTTWMFSKRKGAGTREDPRRINQEIIEVVTPVDEEPFKWVL